MGTSTPNIGIYVPATGETGYGQSFAVGMNYIDNHDHSGPPHGGVQLTATSIADHSITGIKLNSNCADGLSIQYTGGNQLASIKATGSQAIGGSNVNVSVTPSVLPTVFASPFPIGGTAPNTGIFTDLSSNDLQIPNLVSGSGFVKTIANSSKSINADGFVTIIKGPQLNGIGCLVWDAGGRYHSITFYISGVTGDTGIPHGYICQNINNGTVFNDVYISTDGVDVALEVDVSNRGGSTGPATLTWYGDGQAAIGTDVILFPSSYTRSSFIDSYGHFIEPVFGFCVSRATVNATTGSPLVHTFEYFCYGTPGNNVGATVLFKHQQADGTSVSGGSIFTTAPNSGTNVKDTSLVLANFQTPVVNGLWNSLTCEYTGSVCIHGGTGSGAGKAPGLRVGNSDVGPFNNSGTAVNIGYVGATSGISQQGFVGMDMIWDGALWQLYGDGTNNGGGCFFSGATGGVSIASVNSTGASPQTVTQASLLTVNVDSSGNAHAYAFVTKTSEVLAVVPANAYFFHPIATAGDQATYSNYITTVDATPITIATYAMGTHSMVTIEATVNGLTSTFGAAIGGKLIFTVRRAGAGAILVGSPIVQSNEDSGGAPSFTGTVSGNNAIIQVTGEAVTTYNWVVDYKILRSI